MEEIPVGGTGRFPFTSKRSIKTTILLYLLNRYTRMMCFQVDFAFIVKSIDTHVGHDTTRTAVRIGCVLPDFFLGLPFIGLKVPAPPPGGGCIFVLSWNLLFSWRMM